MTHPAQIHVAQRLREIADQIEQGKIVADVEEKSDLVEMGATVDGDDIAWPTFKTGKTTAHLTIWKVLTPEQVAALQGQAPQ